MPYMYEHLLCDYDLKVIGISVSKNDVMIVDLFYKQLNAGDLGGW